MNDIPEEVLKTIEERFGTRFERHEAGEPGTEEPFASVSPESVEEVEWLTRLAARIPLIGRGAGTALYPQREARALVVRFDAMRGIRIPPEPGEDWVEVEPGVTWMVLEERLRERGMGPTVYPTSAPRATVGGWPRTGWVWAPTSTAGCCRTSSRWRSYRLGAGGTSSRARPSGTL
jgi:glycolate oxidase